MRYIWPWLARSSVFAAFFAITTYSLAKSGHLDANYIAAITAIQALVVGRAIMDDYHDRNGGDGGNGANPQS